MDEIARLSALGGAEINEVKKILATEVTAMLHGREAAERAAETARKTFEEGAIAENLPSIDVATAELEAGIGLLTLVVKAGLAASNGEAPPRHVRAAQYASTTSPSRTSVAPSAPPTSPADGVIKLSLGKKKHILVRPALGMRAGWIKTRSFSVLLQP